MDCGKREMESGKGELNSLLVLDKAVLNAAKALGLSQTDLEQVVGGTTGGADSRAMDADYHARALLLIRCYRALRALTGGLKADMEDWLATQNRHLQGVPKEAMARPDGLARVADYLEAMQGQNG